MFSTQTDQAMKTCNKCWTPKPLSEFHKHTVSPDGLRAYCRECNAEQIRIWREENPEAYLANSRRAHLWRKYGITAVAYQEALDAHDGRCARCGTDKPGGRNVIFFHVKRDPETDAVRLLCGECNRATNVEEQLATSSTAQ